MTPEQWIGGIIVAVLGLGGSVFGGLALFAGTKGKTKADAKSALDARIDARLNTEITRFELEVSSLRGDVASLRGDMGTLARIATRAIRAIQRAGGTFFMTDEEIEVLERTRPLGETNTEESSQ